MTPKANPTPAKSLTASRLAKFCQIALSHCWEGHDWDGGDIQDTAEQLGLLRKVTYDPKKHGDTDLGAEPGDDWFVLAPAVTALLPKEKL